MKVINAKNKILNIEKKPFASGGEGAVYLFKDPGFENYCVKIYFDNEKDVVKAKAKAKEREQKVTFMVNNQPQNLEKDNCLLCWPIEVIYDFKTKEFIGFMMPKAFSKSELLYKICLTKNNSSLSKKWDTKYDRKEVSGLISRLKLCVNISSGLNAIHQTQKYVLIDFKPQNVLVTHTGKVSVIDLDSIQINGQFKGTVCTPEYMPPEGNTQVPSKMFVEESWDRFTMAIVFYQLLFGLHPYCITPLPSFSKESTVHSHIKLGLFPFGTNAHYIQTKPDLHDKFHLLPKKFRLLFIRSFDLGHQNPDARPSAQEWGSTIFSEIRLTTSQSNFSKSLKKTNLQKKNKIQTNKTNISQKAPLIIKEKPKSYLKGILAQFVGMGLFYTHPHFSRKWIYFLFFAYAVIDFFLANTGVKPFSSDFGYVTFLISLFVVYVIGLFDVVVSVDKTNNKNV